MFNGERNVPGRRKVVRGSNVLVLTSHVGQNPRSYTALSLIDGRETRPRLYTPTSSSFVSPYGVLRSVLRLRLSALTGLVHASIARGITASFVSLCDAWLRAGTASYQHKRCVIASGLPSVDDTASKTISMLKNVLIFF